MLPATVADVLHLLVTEPGRPRLTWYAAAGERVELSGAVLENWVTKTANLLVDELDVAPGVRVRLDLPPHWRTVLWALAVWRVGGCVVLSDAADDVDVTVSDRPAATAGQALVAVELGPLARRFEGTLPAGALDAAQAVMTYGDVLGWVPPGQPDAVAVEHPGGSVPHAGLLAWAVAGPSQAAGPGSRALVPCDDARGRADGAAQLLRTTLGVLAGSGSVVVLSPDATRELGADGARRGRVLTSERVTVELDAPLP